MPYTPEQVSEIVDAYWTDGGGNCPVDGAMLDLKLTPHMQGYFLLGRCPRCGNSVKATNENDPKISSFRAWNDADRAAIADGYFNTRYSECPVCESSVDVNPVKMLQGTLLMVHCRRCGNSGKIGPDHSQS